MKNHGFERNWKEEILQRCQNCYRDARDATEMPEMPQRGWRILRRFD